MRILIIGGVAAGTKVAAKLKRLNRDFDITIITKSRDISYAGCGLPYYVGGVIEQKEQLLVHTPAQYSALTGVKVLTEHEAISLNPDNKNVKAKNLRTGNIETFCYDHCIIATGASPVIPNIEGVNLQGVFTLRTPDDADLLRRYIDENNVKKAVIVGGGFIGLEIAENLIKRGISPTIIDMAEQILPGFDHEIADYVTRHMNKKGIKINLKTKLTAILGDVKSTGVKTENEIINADIVILSLGIRPNTSFLDNTGIELMPNKTIKVNEKLETSIPGVYAAGDCACVKNRITDRPVWAPMGSSANLEGRVLAEVILGRESSFPGILGTSVAKLPELNVGRTGLSEAAAKEKGYVIETALSVTDDKAPYYPDAAFFAMKLIADKWTHKLLGVQVLGSGAVDKIIDISVVAITMGATLENVQNMDFAYAPPFSTAIHPMAHAVNILLNKINGDMQSITPADYAAGLADEYKIIDAGSVPTIPSAIFVDLAAVDSNNGKIAGIDKSDKLLLVCRKGRRAYLLQNRLKHYGYTNTLVLEGASLFNELRKRSEKVTLTPEDINRVKALGFLHNKGTDCFSARIITRNGKITAEENQCITEAAKKFGNGAITMTTRLTIEVQGVPYDKVQDFRDYVAQAGLETGGTGSLVRPVVSCEGTTCQYGLIDTFAISEEIHERFYIGYREVLLPHKFKIAVGGCPNNCVKPDLNDLGIVGQRKPDYMKDLCKGCTKCAVVKSCPMKACSVNNRIMEMDENLCNNCGRCIGKCPFHSVKEGLTGYKIYIGGRWGKHVNQGKPLQQLFNKDDALDVVEKAILLFKQQGLSKERFSETIDRIGFEEVEKMLLSDELLKNKNEILKIKTVGGASC